MRVAAPPRAGGPPDGPSDDGPPDDEAGRSERAPPVVEGSGRVGLGLRWEFLDEVLAEIDAGGSVPGVDFFEISPENYARRGGSIPEDLERVRARVPILCHGLTTDVGGLAPFEPAFFEELRAFLTRVQAPFFSDHLCVSGFDGGPAHDLLPLPLTRGARLHVVDRVKEVQDRLQLPFALENVSHYLRVGRSEVPEAELITQILEASGAGLLLDVNNVVVNAKNHGFDPIAFLDALPLDRVVQIHIAGHRWVEEHGVVIDTHGADVGEAALGLLERAVERCGSVPVLLERDHHIPPFLDLLGELGRVRASVERGLARRELARRPGSREALPRVS